MKSAVARRSLKEFLFGEDFSSWFVPETSKLVYQLNKEIKEGFYEATRQIKEDGVAVEDAWEFFSEFYRRKQAAYAKRIQETERLHLIIPFYSSSLLKRIAMKIADNKYATLNL